MYACKSVAGSPTGVISLTCFPPYPRVLPLFLPHARAHVVSFIALHVRGLHRHVAVWVVWLGHGQHYGVIAGVEPSGGRQEVHVRVGAGRLCATMRWEGKDEKRNNTERFGRKRGAS